MKTVMRGNKQLQVTDERLEGFLNTGYVEVDAETGTPVNVPEKVNPAALQEENAALKAENEELHAKVTELEAEKK